MTPYSLYNPQTLEITVIVFSDVKPENSTSKMANGQVKPMYDIDNDLIYEGATNAIGACKCHRFSIIISKLFMSLKIDLNIFFIIH